MQCIYEEEYDFPMVYHVLPDNWISASPSKSIVHAYLGGLHLAQYEKPGYSWKYMLLDHLGSTRVVVDENLNVEERLGYTAFGTRLNGTADYSRFTDKCEDEVNGLRYFGARFYNPDLGRFLNEDPAKDGSNWYAYCRNNPLKYTDPTGLEIDTSQLSVDELKLYNYAKSNIEKTERGKELFKDLEKSDKVFHITMNNDGKNGYKPNSQTILWDPTLGLVTGEDGNFSPVVGLAHELGHADQHDRGDLEFFLDGYESQFDMENRNIKHTELPIAKKLKQGLRRDYNDWKRLIKTDGPSSTVEKETIDENLQYNYYWGSKK